MVGQGFRSSIARQFCLRVKQEVKMRVSISEGLPG